MKLPVYTNCANNPKQSPGSKFFFQSKLTINQPGDEYEREADAVAERVMRMRNDEPVRQPFFSPAASAVQRRCQHCEEENALRRKQSSGHGIEAGSGLETYVEKISGGQTLSMATRRFFEPRMGYDLGQVRVHTDTAAAKSAQAVNALAYTTGNNVVFGAGQYRPETDTGKRLLAHELVHVMQQQNGSLNRSQNTEEEDSEVLELGQTTGTIQRQEEEEAPLSRQQEISLSNSSPGEVSATASPFTVSLFNFAINGYVLKARHTEVLRELARLIRSMVPGNFTVLIDGNTDSTGTADVNNPLSVQRARAVALFLRRAGVSHLIVRGEGEERPFTTNERVSGRSRNRRVDINFVPVASAGAGTGNQSPVQGQEAGTVQDGGGSQSGSTPRPQPPSPSNSPAAPQSQWVCAQYPLLCALLPFGGALLLCVLTGICRPGIPVIPTIPVLPGIPPAGEPPPGNDEGELPRACVESVQLPSGAVSTIHFNNRLIGPFAMAITFRNDPTAHCRCTCGEYRQFIRGYFDRYTPARGWYSPPKLLTPGVLLERGAFHEDGEGDAGSWYGHRFDSSGLARPNKPEDSFLPGPENGCVYEGSDNPGSGRIARTEGIRFHLEFIGFPYDRCNAANALELLAHARQWTVDGELTPEPPTPPPVPVPAGGGNGLGNQALPIPVIPRATDSRPVNSHPAVYAGNISPSARVNELYTLRLMFRSGSSNRLYVVSVGVRVTAVTDSDVTVETVNNEMLNVAPEGETPVLLTPHRSITYSRSLLESAARILNGG